MWNGTCACIVDQRDRRKGPRALRWTAPAQIGIDSARCDLPVGDRVDDQARAKRNVAAGKDPGAVVIRLASTCSTPRLTVIPSSGLIQSKSPDWPIAIITVSASHTRSVPGINWGLKRL